MTKRTLPADLAAIVEPLREADEYTRLQHIRQRGFYNLVTGMPMPLLLVAQYLPQFLLEGWDPVAGPPPWWFFVLFASGWALFGVACFPRVFMPLVRRHRPDWQSPLIEASLLKKVLEKVFWVQLACLLGYTLAGALALLTSVLSSLSLLQALAGFGAIAHVIAMTTLAGHARRVGDPALARSYRVLLLLVIPFVLVALIASALAWSLYIVAAMLCLAVIAPPLALGLYRLLSPRRWLIK